MIDSHPETRDPDASSPAPTTRSRHADEPALRAAIEDFFFGFRAFTALPDELLAARGLGRTHHRILYFVRRSPGLSVGELLVILGVTKQAAHRPLADLQRAGLLISTPDPDDRRVRRLTVTDAGRALEAELSGVQMRLLEASFAQAGPDAESGWRRIMAALRSQLGGSSGSTWPDAGVNPPLAPATGGETGEAGGVAPRTPTQDDPGASIDSA